MIPQEAGSHTYKKKRYGLPDDRAVDLSADDYETGDERWYEEFVSAIGEDEQFEVIGCYSTDSAVLHNVYEGWIHPHTYTGHPVKSDGIGLIRKPYDRDFPLACDFYNLNDAVFLAFAFEY